MRLPRTAATALTTDAELISRVLDRDESAVRALVQRYNRRLYRVARSVLRDDTEAEDVLQETYLKAFSALAAFRGDSSLGTWLTRIVLNEALQRVRRRREIPTPVLESAPREAQVIPFPLAGASPAADPERTMAQREICSLLERAIDALPEEYRTVLVARVIEGMSIDETADLLGLRPETVKTRLHRARRQLKADLADHIGPLFSDVFPFAGRRCERMADTVVRRLGLAKDGNL